MKRPRTMPEIDNDLTRREFLIGAGLLTLVPGCGSDEGSDKGTSTNTRTVEHALGETEVPAAPERVVVLTAVAFDPVASLGITPVASVADTILVNEERMSGVESILSNVEPNLEQIAATEPDLILHAATGTELFTGNYEQYSEIAPTVAYGFVSDAKWKDCFRFYADIVGKLDEAEERLAEYEARVEGIRVRLGDSTENTRVSVLQVAEDYIGNMRRDITFADSILDEIGFAKVAELPLALPLEIVPDIEAEAIFVFPFGGTRAGEEQAEKQLEEITSSEIWNLNPAVRSGNSFIVGNHWFGWGITSANAVLDDIEEFLIKGTP